MEPKSFSELVTNFSEISPIAKMVFTVETATPDIKRVIFNEPATIVFWADGSKTVVKCQPGDVYSEETGLALCIAKKYFGNKGNFNEIFKKWIPAPDEISVEEMRKNLVHFCEQCVNCKSCVLCSPNSRCGCGVHFLTTKVDGSFDMSDQEIKDAYAIAFGSSKK